MPKKLIINADDFGFSDGVNKAVEEGFKNGVILSASLMATGDNFDEAVSIAEKNPALGVGVHLNIYRGTPLSDKEEIKTLVGENGKFLGKISKITARLLLGKISSAEVEREWRAQIEKIIRAGIRPSHIDSDKHLHLWPSLFKAAAKLAGEYDIGFIRLVREPFSFNPIVIALNLLSGYNARVASKYGLKTTDCTLGISKRPTSTDALLSALGGAKAESVEFICHPSVEAEKDKLGGERTIEFEVLANKGLKFLVEQKNFEIANFNK